MTIQRRTLLAAAPALLGATAWAQQPFPSRVIRIVPFGTAGGPIDTLARVYGDKLQQRWSQSIIIDAKPGASGIIAADFVAKAPADGYTLGVGAAGGLSANASLYPQMPFDTLKDFQPVTLLAAIPFVIVGSPGLPARNLQQLIALAKAQPGKLSIAHGGNGTAMHLSTALFEQMADIKLVQVPYRGSGPAAMDVLSGQVPLGVVDLPASLQQIKAGKLKALGVSTKKRIGLAPEVPTIDEAGVKGYEMTYWFAAYVPAGTPASVVARLNELLVKAAHGPAASTSPRARRSSRARRRTCASSRPPSRRSGAASSNRPASRLSKGSASPWSLSASGSGWSPGRH